VPDLMITKAIE